MNWMYFGRQLVKFLTVWGSVPSEDIIDCDTEPFVPEGMEVKRHLKGGHFNWNRSRVRLHIDESQHSGRYIEGHNLYEKIVDKSIMNANVLDYLLARQHLIPKNWKGKRVFFWGTIYCANRGGLCVRYLYWNGNKWDWGIRGLHWGGGWWRWFTDWLDYAWGGRDFAALYAS